MARNMNGNDSFKIVVLAAATACLAGCSPGTAPFRMVQFCLAGTQEIPAFASFMDQLAQQHHMEFTDRSGQTEGELRALASDNKNVPVVSPLVNIGADYAGDFNFSAGNLGMPANQIVIGFNGTKPDEARHFADAVVRQLSSRWHVHEVPRGRGASPLSECD
jgi:hypothetical protein